MSTIVIKAFAGNETPTLFYLQRLLESHVALIESLYLMLWIATAVFVLARLYLDYRSAKKH